MADYANELFAAVHDLFQIDKACDEQEDYMLGYMDDIGQQFDMADRKLLARIDSLLNAAADARHKWRQQVKILAKIEDKV